MWKSEIRSRPSDKSCRYYTCLRLSFLLVSDDRTSEISNPAGIPYKRALPCQAHQNEWEIGYEKWTINWSNSYVSVVKQILHWNAKYLRWLLFSINTAKLEKDHGITISAQWMPYSHMKLQVFNSLPPGCHYITSWNLTSILVQAMSCCLVAPSND